MTVGVQGGALELLTRDGVPAFRQDLPAKPFSVGGPPDATRLPIDWAQDPHSARSWRFELHTLQWLDPRENLALCRDVALDWIAQNPRDGSASEFAWYDMAVGRRASKIAFIARASAADGLLDGEQAEAFLTAIREHGTWLADDANYAYGHNHGLFEDEGLLSLADYASALPEAAAWRAHAFERFEASLRDAVDWDDALHLEHSPSYHFTIINMLRRVEQIQPLPARLADLYRRMQETAGWLVAPDGHLPQIGDTHHGIAPKWVPKPTDGVKAMNGVAISRQGGTYLYVTAGYHSSAHKQADELSFVLYEDGEVVVCDAGLYAYDEKDPMRIRARSSQAHNCLVVDDESFDWRAAEPYGNGIRSCGIVGPWAVIEAHNPLVPVEHVRTFFHRPGTLLIHDRVRSSESHRYSRFIHLAQGADVVVTDASDVPSERSEASGWTSPAFRETVPTTTLQYVTEAADASLVLQISA